MPISRLNIDAFLQLPVSCPVLDVRSPGEYAHAHLPRALSLPIFNDEDRKIIGTAYKQESREKAIKIGLDSFGKHMVKLVEAAEQLFEGREKAPREIGIHCWRGGMRSGAVAWLLDLYGFKVYLLNGGYKAYRKWVLQQFELPYSLKVIGGYTGSNKTGILTELKATGEKVIDLEQLAGHQGSAFGNLDRLAQPGQEQFENLLAQHLFELSTQHKEQNIWIEAESQRIGTVNIPMTFFNAMRNSPLLFLDVPFEKRLDFIVQGYGKHHKEQLINAMVRMRKRLGGLETKTAVNCLLEEDIRGCFAILLKYYDKVYYKSTHNREEAEVLISYLESDTTDAKVNMKKIKQHVSNTH